MHTTKNSTRLILDKDSQDCNNFQAQFLTGSEETTRHVEGIVWSFTRKFETCTKNHNEDYKIEVRFCNINKSRIRNIYDLNQVHFGLELPCSATNRLKSLSSIKSIM